jgi:hypothetical protein
VVASARWIFAYIKTKEPRKRTFSGAKKGKEEWKQYANRRFDVYILIKQSMRK